MLLVIDQKTVEEAEEIKNFLLSSETWQELIRISIRVLIIVLLSYAVVGTVKLVIRRVFAVKYKGPIRRSERREKTLKLLLENAVSYVVYFAAILAILEEFGIGVKGLLAGAGVLGLAVGFGAQNLVRDVITGFFILFEDQFSVGDYVQIGEALGTVEEIGLRTTKVIAYGGEVHIIPNGTISEVINYSINNSVAILDIGISYETDIDEAERVINNYLETVDADRYEELVDRPVLIGVQSLEASEVVLRITAETKPTMNFAVARQMRRDLKKLLDDNGIEIPYQKMVIYKEAEGEGTSNE